MLVACLLDRMQPPDSAANAVHPVPQENGDCRRPLTHDLVHQPLIVKFRIH